MGYADASGAGHAGLWLCLLQTGAVGCSHGLPVHVSVTLVQLSLLRNLIVDFIKGKQLSECSFSFPPFSGDHKQKFYWGHKEILIPVYKNMSEAMKKHPDVDVLISFASLRSAFDSTMETMQYPQVKTRSVCTICKVLHVDSELSVTVCFLDSHHRHHCWGNPRSSHQEDHQGCWWKGCYYHWTSNC